MAIVRLTALIVSGVLVGVASAGAQPLSSTDPYVPITGAQRAKWILDGSTSIRSLGAGVVVDTWLTAWNIPEEWGRGWSGIGKRYVSREAGVTISNSVEASLGAAWGEEPRYFRAPPGGLGSRIGFAAKSTVLARRRDGHFAPAWARYAGNVATNIVEESWLPPSARGPGNIAARSTPGLLGRFAGNLFEEFWPDVKKLLRR